MIKYKQLYLTEHFYLHHNEIEVKEEWIRERSGLNDAFNSVFPRALFHRCCK